MRKINVLFAAGDLDINIDDQVGIGFMQQSSSELMEVIC